MSVFNTISSVLAVGQEGTLTFFCKGCDQPHTVNVNKSKSPSWSFNANLEKPTFSPSILVRWTEKNVEKVCHSFVTDGKIKYLTDSTHRLAGGTYDLPNWQESWDNW